MRHFNSIVFILLLTLVTTKVHSQGYTTVHFGTAIPLADFASKSEANAYASGAAVGLNAGLQYTYPLADTGFGVFGGIDINYNSLQTEVEEDIARQFNSLTGGNGKIKFHNFFNIPISAGLNYTYHADEKFGVFANAGLALNFLSITDLEVKVGSQKATVEMDGANSLGFKAGAGIILNKKFSFALNYYGLGAHEIKGTVRPTRPTQKFDAETKINFVALTIGFKL